MYAMQVLGHDFPLDKTNCFALVPGHFMALYDTWREVRARETPVYMYLTQDVYSFMVKENFQGKRIRNVLVLTRQQAFDYELWHSSIMPDKE